MNMLIVFGAKYLIYIALIVSVLFVLLLRKDFKKLFLLGIISLPVAYIVAVILRHFFYNARPFVVEHFRPLVYHAADNGFPSDHILLMATLACLFFPFSKKGSIVLWVLTALVAISRVAAGVHHTLDVVASMIIAIIVVSSMYYFFSSRSKQTEFIQ